MTTNSEKFGGSTNSIAYWACVISQAISLLGTMMRYTALFWLALHVSHGGALALAAVDAAQCLPMFTFGRRAGNIVNRCRPVRVMLATQSLQAMGSLAVGIPLAAGWMTLWYLLAVSFAFGAVQSVDLPARQVLMLDLVGSAGLRRGSSLAASINGLARVAGPGVAGAVIAASGETGVFFADAASFLAVIAVMAWLSRGTLPAGSDAVARDGRRLGWLLDLPRGVKAAAAMALLVGGFGLQFMVTNPLMATQVFHLGAVGFGLLGTFAAIGGIVAAYLSSRRGDPGRSEFLIWALAFGIAECAAAVTSALWAYDAAMIVIGGTSQLFTVSAQVYIQQATPSPQRWHALSVYNAGFIGFVPVGAFVAAGVASTVGVRWALVGPGLLIAVAAAGLLVVVSSRPRSGEDEQGGGLDVH